MSDLDLRAPVVRFIELVGIEAATDIYRFMIGVSDRWRDADGREWVGSEGITLSALSEPINGRAPAGSLTISYFQNPEGPDLFREIKESGDADVEGRALRIYSFFWETEQELRSPTRPPQLEYTFTMRSIVFSAGIGFERSLSVHFEGVNEWRANAGAVALNTEGHAHVLDGEANPSLKFAPNRTNAIYEALF